MIRKPNGFTLLELATTIVIVIILAALLLPVVSRMKRKAQKVHCMQNLRSLQAAASLYIEAHDGWPQIAEEENPADEDAASADYARRWIEALQPYGPTIRSWICPTVQSESEDPDLNLPENIRLDYSPSEFSSGRMLPFKWSTHPWFAEIADAHGNGNLIVFPDGSVKELNDLLQSK